MRKIFLIVATTLALCCLFALGVCASSTNEFGEVEIIPNIDLTEMNEDTVARVVLVDGNGVYHTYPSQYIVSNNTKFYYSFTNINTALGTKYTKNSVVRIEVPDNITIATNCGDLCSSSELLEIKFFPTSQLHTLEYGCFYNNRKLQKLNIPKNVQTIGTLIINNSSLEELVFDDGFSAVLPKDSFKGASGLKKIVFSNQMTAIEDRALDSTLGTSLQEFYMGASLKDLGTNNMAWVKQSVRLYVPAQFLSEVDTITMETYSWWNSSACLPTGVIFFTGTRAQAEALIAKSTYDRLFCSTAELVEWDPSIEDAEYAPAKGWKIVYGYSVCNAFYGEHQMSEGDGVSFVDYFSEITVGNICTRQGCGVGVVKKTIAPIFAYLCVSTTESSDKNGKYSITVGYKVNYNSYNEYLEYGALEFGFVASVISVTGNDPLTVVDGKVEAKNESKTIFAPQSGFSHDYLDLKVTGVSAEMNGESLVLGLYAYNGEEITYLGDPVSINVQ